MIGQRKFDHSQCAWWLISIFMILNNSCPVTRLGSNYILLLLLLVVLLLLLFSCHPCRLSVSLNAIPYRNFSFPRLLLPSTFWASAFLPVFISHSIHMTSLYQPTHHQFLLKTFLHSNPHSQFIQSSLINSLNSHYSSYRVVFANLNLLLRLC